MRLTLGCYYQVKGDVAHRAGPYSLGQGGGNSSVGGGSGSVAGAGLALCSPRDCAQRPRFGRLERARVFSTPDLR